MGKPPTTEWGLRAHAAGLDRTTLALLAGVAPKNVTEGLKGERVGGVPVSLRSIILVWEMLAPDQRAAWVQVVAALKAAP